MKHPIKQLMLVLVGLALSLTAGCTEKGTPGGHGQIPAGVDIAVGVSNRGAPVFFDKNGNILKPRPVNRQNPISAKKILSVEAYTVIRHENECIIEICDNNGCVSYVISSGPCP